jgi:hypothetical protein
MRRDRLELPAFEKFAVSFDELLQEGVRVEVQRGDPKRTNRHFDAGSSWPEVPSPSVRSSFKEIEEPPRPPLYKDRRRVVVFIGLMFAWLFVSPALWCRD